MSYFIGIGMINQHQVVAYLLLLYAIFNIILSSGQIPDIWCQALIMPLYKSKGGPSDPGNIT